MAVMAREVWTDERLDDLNTKVEKGFDEVKGEVQELRREMNSRFSVMDGRFDKLQQTLILGLAGMTTSIVASVIGGVFAVLILG
ncbi:MAG TPA: hypothetical protein VLI94_09940 [Solirubrobacterales bacterium]|nr:hypothetical protein [Solirubrobacterales bacterium]